MDKQYTLVVELQLWRLTDRAISRINYLEDTIIIIFSYTKFLVPKKRREPILKPGHLFW